MVISLCLICSLWVQKQKLALIFNTTYHVALQRNWPSALFIKITVKRKRSLQSGHCVNTVSICYGSYLQRQIQANWCNRKRLLHYEASAELTAHRSFSARSKMPKSVAEADRALIRQSAAEQNFNCCKGCRSMVAARKAEASDGVLIYTLTHTYIHTYPHTRTYMLICIHISAAASAHNFYMAGSILLKLYDRKMLH